MDSKKLHQISESILEWYDKNRRILPWRYAPDHKADPYRVWLSEIMLQQTQVDTVIPYFNRFINAWPTLDMLANANLDDVLHQWQGLGYYARARHLHKCAQTIMNDFQGEFPTTPDKLSTLPGIGPYTSAAIAAIAFNYPATVVDGNIARIVSRFFASSVPIKQNQKQIYSFAESLTPFQRAGDYAQALMDIGSSICRPKEPKCHMCPFQTECKAYASGNPENFPKKSIKKSIPTRLATAFILIKDHQILIRKRVSRTLLDGLWELPGSQWDTDSLPELPMDIDGDYVDVKHTFSHFHLITRVIKTYAMDSDYLLGTEIFCHLKDLNKLALSTLTKKLLINSGLNIYLENNLEKKYELTTR